MHPDEEKRSAAVPAAVSGASRPRYGEVKIRDRGRLPHWEKDSGVYFVTFRLFDSLPRSVLEAVESERAAIIATANQLHRKLSPDEEKRLADLFSEKIEKYLDQGVGRCYLANPAVAGVVAAALKFFDAKRYRLFAWCVMPNHVHVVMRLLPGRRLAEVIHSWKSFTAKECNRILRRQGAFWQREYYDHLVRDAAELDRLIDYVVQNPARANLKGWKWVESCGQDAHTTAAGTAALPPLSVSILQAESADQVEQVRRLFVEYGESLGFSLCFQSFDQELASLPGDYSPPTGRLLLAESDGQAAGCVVLHRLEDSVCEMKRLYVRPAFRGKKIGLALANAVIAEARTIGYTRMRLDTIAASMKEAVAMYRTLGFVEIPPYRSNPIPSALYMELKL